MTRCSLFALVPFLVGLSIGHAEELPPVPSGPVKISDVKVRISDHGPVVLLQAEGKTIPIFVDLTVALSIQGALNGENFPAPHPRFDAHDPRDLRRKGDADDHYLEGGTYYGALTVAVRGDTKVFDSRSSDSIALAIHFKAPIIVSRDLLDSAGRVLEKSKTEDL